jgi:hypothetical protein
MKVKCRTAPDINEAGIRRKVDGDVRAALQSVITVGGKFVVNDSLWYGLDKRGKVKPRVVNSADFISRTFQRTLVSRGWSIPKASALAGQAIDGYIELPLATGSKGYAPDRNQFRSFFEDYWDDHPTEDVDRDFLRYYQTYHRRDFFGLGSLDARYHHHFAEKTVSAKTLLKIGLEFETGNIASSFRALWKLNVLFLAKLIDAGIFITAIDKKNAAGRIWPVANRNGSFEELEHRNYKRNVLLPLWEYSFAPDRFDAAAPHLGRAGTYTLTNAGRTTTAGGKQYEVWKAPGSAQEFLREVPAVP